jgi:enolase
LPTPSAIRTLIGRRVWDSRGRPTVEAEIVLADGSIGRAIAPAGASRGSNEARDLRDGGAAFGGLGVDKALRGLADEIAPALTGLDAADQSRVDARLIELDGTPQKARLGGNAVIAASMAVAHAAAASSRQPLWRYLARGAGVCLPMPMIQIFGGGAHAGRRIDLQDVLLVPVGADSFDHATAMVAEVYRAGGEIMADAGLLRGVADEGGWWPEFASNEEALGKAVRAIERAGYRPGEDVALALDVAASEFGKDGVYRLAADDRSLTTGELVERLAGWCGAYPIVSLEDPLAEDDHAGMRAITALLGERVQIIGDDYLVTSAARVADAATDGACNAVLVKPNQVGTLTEARSALDAARSAGWRAIVSARSGESEDVTIVHLAVGWGAEQLKVGSFARSERMAKWNEAIRVEQALGAQARFAGREAIGGISRKAPAA